MNKTLRWKKTIGILAIVLGGLRFVTGINTYSQITSIETTLKNYSSYFNDSDTLDIKNFISLIKNILPLELIALAAILTLGIVILCVDKGIPHDMPREKSRKICIGILIAAIIHLILEIVVYIDTPSVISDDFSSITVILSLGFILALICFCIAGLSNRQWGNEYLYTYQDDASKTQTTISPTITEQDSLDEEIDKLRKQIEKRKLEKEMEQINSEKQAEIEKLKKELSELE